MARVVTAHTPLGPEQLLFRSMHGSEGLSQLFEFEVDLLSPTTSVDMKAMLGKPLTLEVKTLDGTPRYLNGQVTRFTMIGREGASSRYTVYRASVRPWLWYLTRTSDCKIFQNKSVVEIIEEVLGDYGFAFEKKLSASYRQWDYCVQYQETDFAFVSRLMEHEGIYYFFKHDKNQHTLVLADDMSAHETLPQYPRISYLSTDRVGDPGREAIDRWEVTEEIRPGTYVVDDFDFKKPKADLLTTRSQPRGHDHGQYEMYEWMGGFSDSGQGEHYARIRLEEAQAQAELDIGHATVRGMAPGYRFKMQNAPREEDNREYLIVSVLYSLREGGYASGSAEGDYGFQFGVQPTSFAFRAPRVTRIPVSNGPQTATVVGPPGEDIWIDKYGRVKVQFRWDRYGKRNEDSSCWVRVSSAWAGSNFGAVNHPRVGQEVIVDFIAGCLDRPIIIGRVYNADQMPPLELPAKATVSGFISRTIKGDGELANHFVIDDDPSNESIKIHAQKDFSLNVENNETHTVDGTRVTVIEGADTYTTNTSLDETVNGPHTLTVNKGGPQTITVNGGDQFIKVDGGNQQVDVIGNQTIHVTGTRKDTVDSGEERIIGTSLKEDIAGPQTTTVVGKYTEESNGKGVTVNGGELYFVDGSSMRIMSGTESIGSVGDMLLTTGGKMTVQSVGADLDVKTTAGDIHIVASGDVVLEGNNVRRTNRTHVIDTAPSRHTETTGLSYSINGSMELHNGTAQFYNDFQYSQSWAKADIAMGTFTLYDASITVGGFTTTQTAFQIANKGFELFAGFKLYA
ncbi:MAG: type VI secretion system tip protein VgrG [Variovorax sp.]|nr:MAG: type VI secretion system tip protein VgrG [Variovorax sp.]